MSRPTAVFVAGSRQISRLPAEVRSRLDTMIEKGFQILVGDANGADKAVQRYLADKSKGTVNNVVNLSRDHKPVVVYVAPTKRFRTIKSFDDLKDLLAEGDSDSVERIVSELGLSAVRQRAAG
jgi:hypothetical protein